MNRKWGKSLAAFMLVPLALFAQQPNDDDDELDQAITFTLPAEVTAGTTAALNGVASSGLPVSYQSQTLSVCTVLNGQVTYLIPGTCTIRATQPGNNLYEDADPVTRTTTVVAAATLQPQTITFTLPGQAAPGTTGVLLGSASSGLPVTYVSNTPSVCTVVASSISYLTVGTCTVVASQAGNGTFAAATAVSQTTIVVAAEAIPTVGEWGMIGLSGLLLLFGLWQMRNRSALQL
jgi:hypothetical protein